MRPAPGLNACLARPTPRPPQPSARSTRPTNDARPWPPRAGSWPQMLIQSPLDLDDMTKEELLALGEEMDLDLKTAMRKQDIVRTIRRSRS